MTASNHFSAQPSSAATAPMRAEQMETLRKSLANVYDPMLGYPSPERLQRLLIDLASRDRD